MGRVVAPAMFVGLLTLGTAMFAAGSETVLPEGKGKDAVENTCTGCHSLRRIVIQRLDEDGWTSILREMTENGASIGAGDTSVISQYLAKNFGPDRKVNVNSAQADELASVLRLTEAEAESLVHQRTANGVFTDMASLHKALPAVADKIEARRQFVEF